MRPKRATKTYREVHLLWTSPALMNLESKRTMDGRTPGAGRRARPRPATIPQQVSRPAPLAVGYQQGVIWQSCHPSRCRGGTVCSSVLPRRRLPDPLLRPPCAPPSCWRPRVRLAGQAAPTPVGQRRSRPPVDGRPPHGRTQAEQTGRPLGKVSDAEADDTHASPRATARAHPLVGALRLAATLLRSWALPALPTFCRASPSPPSRPPPPSAPLDRPLRPPGVLPPPPCPRGHCPRQQRVPRPGGVAPNGVARPCCARLPRSPTPPPPAWPSAGGGKVPFILCGPLFAFVAVAEPAVTRPADQPPPRPVAIVPPAPRCRPRVW